ncbi:hypothetical protein [uncultured Shewanella sp.]|uniref:hypothetical protein n=1 Tax=uncultured Shewanella sp. TaxID=173975 RepID=UPI00260AFC80|nr:hypothetical protein [uncultured Shewanella sp.]
MYNIVETRAGKTLILNQLISDIWPLLKKCVSSLNTQKCEEDLLCWVVDVFSEDFEEEYGSYSQEYLEKLVLCCLNSRHYLIKDVEQFCHHFNDEPLDLEIGFDKAFYPVGIGHWHHFNEFVLISDTN